MVPALRFPEFRNAEAWGSEFGDVLFEQISNKTHNSDIPILAITQEHGAIPRNLIDYHVSVTDKSIEGYKVVEVGDFIISLRSFQGGIEYSRYRGICSPAYVILRLKPGYSADYFRHFLKTDRFIALLTKNLEGLRDGKMVSYKQFSELSLPTPSEHEQQKIADCLTSIDELITTNTQKLNAFKTHKKGLMQQLFPTEGETVPKVRFPEFQNADVWIKRPLHEVADVNASGDLDSENFSPTRTEVHIYPIYSNSVTEEGLYGYCTFPKYPKNSVTITARGTLGVAFYRDHDYVGIGRLLVLSNLKNVVPYFLQEIWNYSAKMPLENGGIPQLTAIKARAVELWLPKKEEQQKIVDCLTPLDELISAQAKKIETLKSHKKGLMQQLFPIRDEVGA